MSPQPLQISQLGSEKLTPDNSDLIPIQQANGITRRITKKNLLVPALIKTVADDGDYFVGIDSSDTPYRISKANLLAGLTGGSSNSSSWNGTIVFKSLFNATPPIDIALGNTISLVGSAAIDSSSVLLSGGSLLTGANGYAVIPNKIDYDFNAANFIIDFFIKFNSVAVGAVINKFGGAQSNSTFVIQLDSAGNLGIYFYHSGSNYVSITGIPVSTNTNYYVAIKRVGATISAWINGVQKGTVNIGTNSINNTTANILIGSEAGGTYYGNFKIDNLRITLNGDNDLSVIPTS